MSDHFQPQTIQEAQAWVEAQAGAQAPFQIVGAGTRYTAQGAVLNTQKLTRIRFLEPENMVVGVDAGLPWAQLQQQLAAHNMRLPVNPWFRGATVGGVFSANEEGPERVMTGGLRDYVIGVEMIDASGRVVKAGGRVVKNVSGYDVARTLCGSMGGLVLITSLNFKVMPAPIEAHCLLVTVKPSQLDALMDAFRDRIHLAAIPLRWTQLIHRDGSWQFGLGFDGRPARRLHIGSELAQAMATFAPQVVAEADTPTGYRGLFPEDRDRGFLSPFVDDLGGLGGHLYLNTTVRQACDAGWLGQLAVLCDTLVAMPASGSVHLLWRQQLESDQLEPVLLACQQKPVQRWLFTCAPMLRERHGWVAPKPASWPWVQRLKRELDPQGLFLAPYSGQTP